MVTLNDFKKLFYAYFGKVINLDKEEFVTADLVVEKDVYVLKLVYKHAGFPVWIKGLEGNNLKFKRFKPAIKFFNEDTLELNYSIIIKR